MADKKEPGLYTGLPNHEYHSSDGAVSKTILDQISHSPSLVQWARDAPVDEEAVKAVDIGNAFEALLLEPERFQAEYIQAPDVDKRTKDGKAEIAAFLEEAEDKHVLSRDEWRQIHFMRDSTFAHPMARVILESENVVQGSYFWIDPVTDQLCKCRPDVIVTDERVNPPVVVDVKTTTDMVRFRRNCGEFRYHVQSAWYADGLHHYYGQQPHFIFLVACTSRAAGRYPVHIVELDIEAQHQGTLEYRRDLERYVECVRRDDWADIETITLPAWARSDVGG